MHQFDPLVAETYVRVGIDGTWICGFKEVAKILGDLKGKEVLDYGSGTGRSTRFLKELGANVRGVDIDPEMVEKSKSLSPELNFDLVSKDGVIPISENTFDIAFSSFVHDPISSYEVIETIAKEVFRVLKPNGKYIILTANSEMWGNEYDSFLSKFPEGFTGKRGEKVYVKIKTDPPIDGYDHYWKEEDHVEALRKAGFKEFSSTRPKPENDISKIPPFMVLVSRK